MIRVAWEKAGVVIAANIASCAIIVAVAFIRRGRRHVAVVLNAVVHEPFCFFEAFLVASVGAIEAFVEEIVNFPEALLFAVGDVVGDTLSSDQSCRRRLAQQTTVARAAIFVASTPLRRI